MINISTSALKPSQYRRFVKGWDKGRYADIFAKYATDDKAYRFTLPLSKSTLRTTATPVAPLPVVKAELDSAGYIVDDYIGGYAVDSATGKRRMRIGRVLKSPEAIKAFANDERRAATKQADGQLMVVFSRHPYDIAGMSTDRGWTSCMNLVDGSNRHYVDYDVKHGSIIAYLVDKNDLNIREPKARILMRVYKARGKTGLFPASIYGTARPSFHATVAKWCSEVNSEFFNVPYGLTLKMLSNLYNDGELEMTQLPFTGRPAENMRTVLQSGHIPKLNRKNMYGDFRNAMLGILDTEVASHFEDPDSPEAAAHYVNSLADLMQAVEEERPQTIALTRHTFVELALSKLNIIGTDFQKAAGSLSEDCVRSLTTAITSLFSIVGAQSRKVSPNEDAYLHVFEMFSSLPSIAKAFHLATMPGSVYSVDDVLTYLRSADTIIEKSNDDLAPQSGVASILSNPYLSKEVAKLLTSRYEPGTVQRDLAEMANLARKRITLKAFEKRVSVEGLQRILDVDPDDLPMRIRVTRQFKCYAKARMAKPETVQGTMAAALQIEKLENMFATIMVGTAQKTTMAIGIIAARIQREGYKAKDYMQGIVEAAKIDVRAVRHSLMLGVAKALTAVEYDGMFPMRDSSFQGTSEYKAMAKAMRTIMIDCIATPEAAARTMATLYDKPREESYFPPYQMKDLAKLPKPLPPYYFMALPFVTSTDGILTGVLHNVSRGAVSNSDMRANPSLILLGYMSSWSREVREYGSVEFFEDYLCPTLQNLIEDVGRWEQLRSGLDEFVSMLPSALQTEIAPYNFVTYIESGIRSMVARHSGDTDEKPQRTPEQRIRDVLRFKLRRASRQKREPDAATVDRYFDAIMRIASST